MYKKIDIWFTRSSFLSYLTHLFLIILPPILRHRKKHTKNTITNTMSFDFNNIARTCSKW